MVNILHGQIIKQEFLKDRFLIHIFLKLCISDISDMLVSNPKLFADDNSLFSVIQDVTLSGKNLNDDRKKINKLAFQLKMSFNPDPNK